MRRIIEAIMDERLLNEHAIQTVTKLITNKETVKMINNVPQHHSVSLSFPIHLLLQQTPTRLIYIAI